MQKHAIDLVERLVMALETIAAERRDDAPALTRIAVALEGVHKHVATHAKLDEERAAGLTAEQRSELLEPRTRTILFDLANGGEG